MAIDLATKYAPYTDEVFKKESKKTLLTNDNFDWTGAKTIKVYKITTSDMNNYNRDGADNGNWSRYGPVAGLDATTQEMPLMQDRSFTFAIDKMDTDETVGQLAAASALARQIREKVIPEVDTVTYARMCAKAGHKPAAVVLTAANIYDEIIKGSKVLDDAEVPEEGRFIVVTPAIYLLLKKSPDIEMETDIGNDMRLKGVVSILDGANVVKVPEIRLADGFGFMIGHPVATVAPVKLADYKIHDNPPGINGNLVEGRIYYDAFVLDNKASALYYQAQK